MGDFILIKLGLTFEKLFDFFGSPIGGELVDNIQRSLIIGISFIYIHPTLKNTNKLKIILFEPSNIVHSEWLKFYMAMIACH